MKYFIYKFFNNNNSNISYFIYMYQGDILSESRSAKLVVVFVVAIAAFGVGSIAAISTGGIFGLDLLSFTNNSHDNSSNPFSLDMDNSFSKSLSSSNNYYSLSNNNNSNNKNNNNGNGDSADDGSGSGNNQRDSTKTN